MLLKKRNKSKVKMNGGYYDYNLLAVVIILMCFGLVMLYSASSYEAGTKMSNDLYYLQHQLIISIVAVIFAIAISKLDYHFFYKISPILYGISILLMAMVKYTPLGVTAGGARRWLGIGTSFSFQPSEIAKIAVILFITHQIIRMGREFYTAKGVGILLLYGGLAAFAAYYFTENLSTAIIIMVISIFIIFIAHPRTKPFVIAFIIFALVAAIGIFILRNFQDSESFRLRRVLVWLNPEKYSDYGGYQVLQGLYAIGSGGFFGKGLGNSTQKLDTIPEAQNDMIFSIICEELGLFGAILVLLLFAYLLYRLFCIAQNAPDLQGCLIASGIFVHITLQVVLNICVVLNIIPTTGVTLPFVSYGGTSVLFLMIEIGLALGISSQINLKVKAPAPTKQSKISRRKVNVDKLRHS